MKKSFVRFFLFVVVSIVFATSAYAEHLFGPDELDTNYGAIIRVRQEIWDDVVTLDSSNTGSGADRNFFRLKTSLFANLDYDKKVALFLKLTNEAKYYGTGPFNFKAGNDKFDPDELVFDNLYVDAKNIGGLPVDIRIGRQDFIGTYGEGFLLMDGTPGDGSRTYYFNAAKVNVRLSQNVNFDLTYISDPKTDVYLPSIHPSVKGSLYVDNKKLLTGSDEQAFVAYGRGKINNLTLEPYYVYKTEQPVNGGIVPSKLKLNTVGARLLYTVDSWNIGGEFAHQFGDYDNGQNRRGTGGYAFVGRKYEAIPLKPEWELRYIYLSGDKPGTTDKIETWDPLFSRSPYWNELFIYTLVPETAKFGGPIPGYWTNLELLKASIKLNFTPATNLALSYQYLWAPESTQGLTAAMFSNSGHSRGHLPTAILSHKFSKSVDGYLQVEYFVPGNFYNKDKTDNATFFRWQLQIKI
jgi:hypothetical protein